MLIQSISYHLRLSLDPLHLPPRLYYSSSEVFLPPVVSLRSLLIFSSSSELPSVSLFFFIILEQESHFLLRPVSLFHPSLPSVCQRVSQRCVISLHHPCNSHLTVSSSLLLSPALSCSVLLFTVKLLQHSFHSPPVDRA